MRWMHVLTIGNNIRKKCCPPPKWIAGGCREVVGGLPVGGLCGSSRCWLLCWLALEHW